MELQEQTYYGVWGSANDKTVAQDIRMLAKIYHPTTTSSQEYEWPYVVLSKNYNPQTRNFDLFIGGTSPRDNMNSLVLPAGKYASITIKPKWGFLWGVAIGTAKRYFYNTWLPQSSYRPLNLEYELHTECSVGKHPTVDIIFAIQEKQ